MLDEETREAARELAARYGCSTSEAIRRAVQAHHASTQGVSEEFRRQRVAALARLCELFEGHDADAEIRRLEQEDEFS